MIACANIYLSNTIRISSSLSAMWSKKIFLGDKLTLFSGGLHNPTAFKLTSDEGVTFFFSVHRHVQLSWVEN